MVSPALNPEAYWEFKGEILVLHHPTTISPRYQAMGIYLFVLYLFQKYLLMYIFSFKTINTIWLKNKYKIFYLKIK